MKPNAIFAVLIVLVVALVAYMGLMVARRPKPKPPTHEIEDLKPLTKSKAIDINFYLDTTMSMRGYLAQPDGVKNYFNEILYKAEGTLRSGWPTSTFCPWGFADGDPKEIALRDYLGNPGNFTGIKTFIDRAIRHNPARKPGFGRASLKIIVTDLYQDSADSGALAVALGDVLEDPSRAVGIVAVRNPFDGVVDDLPGNRSLPRGAADSMPFYLLMDGQRADVEQGIHELQRNLGLDGLSPSKKLAFIFSQRQADKLNQPLQIKPAHPERPGYSSIPDALGGVGKHGIPYLIASKGDIRLIASNFPDPELSKLGPHVQVGRQPERKAYRWQGGKDAKWVESPDQAAGLTVDAKNGAITVDRSKLAPRSVQLFQVEFIAERTQLNDLNSWSLELSEMPKLMSDRAFDSGLDGSAHAGRTPNLRHFLQTLQGKMFLTRIPLARYSFFVKSN